MYVTVEKPYNCDNPDCPSGPSTTPMEKLLGLGLRFDHCGAVVCAQVFGARVAAEADARVTSDRAVASQAAVDTAAVVQAISALGPKAADFVAPAQMATQSAAQAAADAAKAPAPADAREQALAASKQAAQLLDAATVAAQG